MTRLPRRALAGGERSSFVCSQRLQGHQRLHGGDGVLVIEVEDQQRGEVGAERVFDALQRRSSETARAARRPPASSALYLKGLS
jgi:hypothetical protein